MKTWKFLMYAIAPMMLAVGCSDNGSDNQGPDNTGDTSGLVATVSPAEIMADGQDVALIEVRFNGQPLAIEEVEFYDNASNKKLGWETYEYTTTVPGSVTFWVSYKTYNTKQHPLTITARSEDQSEQQPVDYPNPVEDPQPSNTAFVHRNLLIDFTGTWCGYCPYMVAAMREIQNDAEYADKVVMAASHNGDEMQVVGDPLVRMLGIGSFPTIVIDYRYSLNNAGATANLKRIQSTVDLLQREDAKAGIAAAVASTDDTVMITATVKAGETGEYCVGAWLLEDGIQSRQTVYGSIEGDFNTHNHVIRRLDSKTGDTSNQYGHILGEIEAGATADEQFEIRLLNTWKKENCSVVLFVSTKNAEGVWYITNAVHLESLDGKFPFEYTE